MIDTIDRLSVTSSVVVFEVAPATVLVDSVKVILSQNVGDGSRLWSVGLDQTSDVSVGKVGHLFFHGLESGMGVPDKKSRCKKFHGRVILCCLALQTVGISL